MVHSIVFLWTLLLGIRIVIKKRIRLPSGHKYTTSMAISLTQFNYTGGKWIYRKEGRVEGDRREKTTSFNLSRMLSTAE